MERFSLDLEIVENEELFEVELHVLPGALVEDYGVSHDPDALAGVDDGRFARERAAEGAVGASDDRQPASKTPHASTV